MPRIAHVLAETTGHAHDNRRREPIRRPPAKRSAVVELLRGGIGVFAELNLGDRHQATDGHSDCAADDSLFRETRIEHPLVTELSLQSFRHEVDAALPPDVFAE